MSVAEQIRPFVIALYMGDTFAAAGQSTPEMLDYAKQEILRLRQTGGRRVLAEDDYECHSRCVALEKLVALWEPPA